VKIFEEYREQNSRTIKVTSATYLGDFTIQINFHDGVNQTVDFKPFLTKSQHPSIRKYLNEETFINFKIIDGNLNWNEFDMIFPIWDLYKGKIES
jgi:ribosomal protein S4E